ncbi:MAG: hypothetical protein ABIL09_10940 [Gemmatimonadota bacterium]
MASFDSIRARPIMTTTTSNNTKWGGSLSRKPARAAEYARRAEYAYRAYRAGSCTWLEYVAAYELADALKPLHQRMRRRA